MRNTSNRPDVAAWWVNQLTYRLHRYLARPDADMRSALLNLMEQYENAVDSRQVKAPNFLFPTERAQ
jgi:hypothetical protein